MKLTKNVDSDSGCDIGLDVRSNVSTNGEWGKNVVIFCADNNLSMHADNRTKDTLVLNEGPINRLDNKISEVKYAVNVTKSRKKICFDLHYNAANSFLWANGTKFHHFKTKESVIKFYSLCLEKILKEFTTNNMKKSGSNGKIYNFFVMRILISVILKAFVSI